MSKYAEGTVVPIAKSRTEIEQTLKRYKATSFIYGEDGNHSLLAFQMRGRHYRFELRYPPLEDLRYTRTNVRRTDSAMKSAWEQEMRRLWRGLALIIKAKLEAVEAGIVTLEEEFIGNTVLPNNETFAQHYEPQIKEVYERGLVPPLLPGLQGPSSTRPRQITGAKPDYIDAEITTE